MSEMTGNTELPDLSHLNVVGPHGETVGRIVHYVQPAKKRRTVDFPCMLLAAIVTKVDAIGDPNLVTFSVPMPTHLEVDIIAAPFSPVLREGHWSWPAKT